VLVPMPGVPNAGFFFIGPLVTASALAALWRFDADPPPVASLLARFLPKSGSAAPADA
jgi:hypothetical protein